MGAKEKVGKLHGKTVLGKALIKDRLQATRNQNNVNQGFIHITEIDDGLGGGIGLNSVTETGDLEEFLATAKLAERSFAGEKLNIKLITEEDQSQALGPEEVIKQKLAKLKKEENFQEFIRCPRRPKCDFALTKENTLLLNQKERENFLLWRRNLAEILEANQELVMTPFEKNLEVWRQFWRVMEKSDVVVQIVDARNPLVFLNEDVFKYAKEISPEKRLLLVVNKADYLNRLQRQAWADHFKRKNIDFVFWSAFLEGQRMEMVKHIKDILDEDMELFKDIDRYEIYSEIGRRDLEDLKKTELRAAETSLLYQQKNLDLYDFLPPELKAKVIERIVYMKEDILRVGDQSAETTRGIDADFNVYNHTQKKHKKKSASQRPRDSATTASSDNDETFSDTNPETGSEKPTDARANDNDNGNDLLLKATEEELAGLKLNPSDIKIIHGSELFNLLLERTEAGKNVVGLIGYPNVGKSSTVNALINTYNFISKTKKNKNKVSVSATPGHTKHFQTIVLDQLDFFRSPAHDNHDDQHNHDNHDDAGVHNVLNNRLILCDCPGLVFPMFMSSKADMIVNGILPADQLREPIAPATLIAQRISREAIEAIYGFEIIRPHRDENQNRAPTGDELLHGFGRAKGFMTAHGLPDIQRAARLLIKDYINGKLLYCHAPPDFDIDFYNPQLSHVGEDNTPLALRNATKNLLYSTHGEHGGVRNKYYDEVDKHFLTQKEGKVVARDKSYQNQTSFTRVQHFPHQIKDPSYLQSMNVVDYNEETGMMVFAKPPKKGRENHNKREKMRRKQKEELKSVNTALYA